MVDRARLAALLQAGAGAYAERNPRSGGVRVGGAPVRPGADDLDEHVGRRRSRSTSTAARGARVTDVDGHEYVDFCLGDTGAMAGHSPAPVVAAVQRRFGELGGVTTMLPTEDAEWVGAELTRRFGLPLWSFTLTATDANRWAIRLARAVTGRPKILRQQLLLPRRRSTSR